MKKLKGYRTILFQIVMAGVTIAHLRYPELMVPEEAAVQEGVDTVLAGIATLWGAGNVVLRFITNTPVGKKETKVVS